MPDRRQAATVEELPPREVLQKIIYGEDSGDLLVKKAEDIANILLENGLAMDQVRSVFDEIKKIENIWLWHNQEKQAISNLYLLKPRLAARAARVKGADRLHKVVSTCIDIITTPIDPAKRKEAFVRFTEFMEAIVAYHKFYGSLSKKEQRGGD